MTRFRIIAGTVISATALLAIGFTACDSNDNFIERAPEAGAGTAGAAGLAGAPGQAGTAGQAGVAGSGGDRYAAVRAAFESEFNALSATGAAILIVENG